MIAALDLPYSGTDALNYASAFVSNDYRQRNRIHLVANDNVGVAHSGRDDSHQYLVRTRLKRSYRGIIGRRSTGQKRRD